MHVTDRQTELQLPRPR